MEVSFLGGCCLALDGVCAALFYLFFDWIGLSTIAIFGSIIIAIPLIVFLIKLVIEEAKKEKEETERNRIRADIEAEECIHYRHRQITICYPDELSEDDFQKLAHRVAKRIKRLTIDIAENAVITGHVDSQSGISTWEFVVDFDDYGTITGNYWMRSCDNYDSGIPERFAELMKQAIKEAIR